MITTKVSHEKQKIIQRMNKVMLSFANDIETVDRNLIIEFLESMNLTYREDYVDFLAKFGGSCCTFFQTHDFTCTFEEIKEIYLENAIYDPMPPNGYCIFSNQIVEDCYIIENSSGFIYREGYYDDTEQYIIGNLLYKSIDEFLWERLFSTYHEEISDLSIETFSENEILDFLKNLENCKLLGSSLDSQFYLKDNIIYLHHVNDTNVYKYALRDIVLNVIH